jgi:pyruvate,water dikinase
MKTRYVIDLNRKRRPGRGSAWGNKALGLWFLQRQGFTVPRTYVCTWEAYRRWAQGDHRVIAELRDELAQTLDRGGTYAVRSSANVEDAGAHSFAGQFRSLLDVRGRDGIETADAVAEAIVAVWSHVRSAGVEAYLEQVNVHPDAVHMGVLVQEMVSPAVSGVAFSLNPLTGMDEVIVEAVRGSGEQLVQDGIRPQRWVNKWGAWIEKDEAPTANDAAIGLDLIERVVDYTRSIAKRYGRPVDLEWVWDGTTLYWVQLREITAIHVDVYSNKISREVFPGLIKPLIWSVNVPLVNGAWVKLFGELIGPHDIDPNELARSFYSRAYFNMGAVGRIFEILGFPRESLELLMGIEVQGEHKPGFKPTAKTFRLLPRMLLSAVRLLGFGRRVRAFLPAAKARYQRFAAQPLADWDERQLTEHVEKLYALTQETAYYNIVTPLLMQAYHALLKSRLARLGVDLDSVDLLNGVDALEQTDPGPHLLALHHRYRTLGAAVQAHIAEQGYAGLRSIGAESFRTALDQFLAQFGHLSDSGNDFSAVPWRETPDLVLDMVRHYPDEIAAGTHTRFQDLDLPPLRKALLYPLYRRARRFLIYRDAISSLYTYGYGLFRDAFLVLGARFVDRGWLSEPEDVFYLELDQVQSLAGGAEVDAASVRQQVEQRNQALERDRDLVPPSIVYGDQAPDLQTGPSDTWEGTATSRGRYSGPVRVVQGIQDFPKVRQGDVLVIPYADVGWTPLFARAGAVIAESGGMLSHSSIVAREYHIPAVVSVAHACQLADDTIVSVDGYLGTITVHGAA